MSGIIWHIFVFGAITIFLIVIIYRTLAIIKLPVHLRWELAPMPHEKGRNRYGGSYLEEFEWWHKPQPRSRIAPLLYMAKEIFLLRSIWANNRTLWPFSFTFHTGIYLVAVMLLLSVINAIFIITKMPSYILNITLAVASVFAAVGYLLGSLGTIGLLLKRTFDFNFRIFSTFAHYFNLLLLGAVFISGSYAWLHSVDFASEMSLLTKRLITLDSSLTTTPPLSLHVVITLVFLIYLPLSNMIHFITKYFTYHEIRWNDKPLDKKMEAELRVLLAQSMNWSAAHVKADGKKNWLNIATEKTSNEKKF